MGKIQCHTTLLASSSLDADPRIVRQCRTTSTYGTLLAEPGAHKDTKGLSNYSGISEDLLVLFFTKRVLNPLVVKDRLLWAGSKKASPEWKAASFKLDNRSGIV